MSQFVNESNEIKTFLRAFTYYKLNSTCFSFFVLFYSCWLAGMNKNNQFDFAKPMFWGFLLPVGLILVYNLILLIVTAVTMCKIDPKLRR